MIQFQSLARNVEIGANSYLLTLGKNRILLDAGMHPKKAGENALPDLGEIDYGSIDAAILSHAHLDHSGAMPVVQRSHPDMPVFMSPATCVLTEALLHNSVNVMTYRKDSSTHTVYHATYLSFCTTSFASGATSGLSTSKFSGTTSRSCTKPHSVTKVHCLEQIPKSSTGQSGLFK